MSDRRRLLFLHTGGTLGMKGDPGPLAPAHYSETVLPFVRGLEELADIEHSYLCNIDSSDMTPELWEGLARTIAEGLDDFDGFLVLHGTDTMAYSAAALSYLLQDLPKPVVFTGAQRPLAHLRSDGRLNLVHAAICATLDVPEVGVFFSRRMTRGNRTTKSSVQSYDAYRSPGVAPLVKMGVDIEYPTPARRPTGPFRLHSGFDERVAVLHLFPHMSATTLDALVDSGVRAVLLLAFGAGNLPLKGWPEAVRRATDAGVSVIVGTQCIDGAARLGSYAGSAAAADAGALCAGSMTVEGALTKAMFLLGQSDQPEEFRLSWNLDLAGEL